MYSVRALAWDEQTDHFNKQMSDGIGANQTLAAKCERKGHTSKMCPHSLVKSSWYGIKQTPTYMQTYKSTVG